MKQRCSATRDCMRRSHAGVAAILNARPVTLLDIRRTPTSGPTSGVGAHFYATVAGIFTRI